MTTSSLSKPLRTSPRRRWANWQQSLLSKQYLTPEAAALGYTLLRLPPQEREVFFDLVSLLLAHGRCEAQTPSLLDDPTTAHTVPEAQDVWQDWRRWTRRLTAYLTRLAEGKDGTRPVLPEAFAGLLDVEELR